MDERARAVLAERVRIAKVDTTTRHVLLCGAADCDAAGDPAAALRALKHAVAAAGLRRDVMVSEAACLEICEHGPICVVHPDDVWYAEVDEDAARRIVAEHLQGGEVVAENAFHVPPET